MNKKVFFGGYRTLMALRSVIPILVALACLLSCEKNATDTESLVGVYAYQPPEQLNDDWPVSTLQEEGIETSVIEQITDRILDGTFRGIRSFMIVKNGAIVHEVYFENLTDSSLQTIYSITKSVSSALIGIAIDQGFIESVEEPACTFFPQYGIENPVKQRIRIHHILTLTTGLSWDEKTYPYTDPRNTEVQMVMKGDWMRFVMERPMQNEPGTEWVYNTGSVHLLSGIIKRIYGDHADVFTERYLFKPLAIQVYEWNKDPQGHPCTGGTLGGLKLRLRDMAKFGYLFLNHGRWKTQQVIPGSWVEISTAKHVAFETDREFGYLWWRGQSVVNGKQYNHFYAAGYGGQTIHINPELDMMIIFTCWDRAQDADIFLPILMVYSAVQSG